jgi:hypothetical protein
MLLSTVKAAADIAKTAAPAVQALPYIGPVVTIVDNIITVINADGDVRAAFAADGAVPKELELLKVSKAAIIITLQPAIVLFQEMYARAPKYLSFRRQPTKSSTDSGTCTCLHLWRSCSLTYTCFLTAPAGLMGSARPFLKAACSKWRS